MVDIRIVPPKHRIGSTNEQRSKAQALRRLGEKKPRAPYKKGGKHQ